MAYVVPNTTIKLLQDVRLDPSYINSIYFASSTAQYTYFASKAKYTLTNYSYQRTGRNVIRVGLPESGLHDCRYLMFQNTTYESKWFYAFITDTEYVNDNTSDVTYVIDEIQTWMFEMSLAPCMIERRHVANSEDVIGANINPEPFKLMELVYDPQDMSVTPHTRVNSYPVINFATFRVVIQVADVDSGVAVNYGDKYDETFSGAKLFAFELGDATSIQAIQTFLAQYSQHPDTIIGMYLVPTVFLPTITQSHQLPSGARAVGADGLLAGEINGTELFGTYQPKNKKLYTYPYNMCEVFTSDGQKMKLRYEYGVNLGIRINVEGTITTPVQIVIRPTNYKGYGETNPSGYTNCFDEHLTITNIPLCSWTNDYYSTWVAQNALPIAVGTALTLGGVLAPGVDPVYEATLTKAGEITQKKIGHFMQLDPDKAKHSKWFDYETDAYNQVAENAVCALPNAVSALQQMYCASIHADQFRGNANVANSDIANGHCCVFSHRAHIPEQQAKMIDDYFEKYGYAIGRIETPNIHIKSHWTYIKTNGCTIVGKCPASSARFVQSIYDRGITFWSNGDEVGDYSLNNHA